jgi:uncharacterized membrane protein YfcA
MSVTEFTLLVGLGSLVAGFLGSLTGMGGGVVIVPLLALVFHVDVRYAIGASLVSVIATSSGAAAAYVKAGYTNVRIGMLLEVATTLGAITGAFVAVLLPASIIEVVLGMVLILSAYLSSRPRTEHAEPGPPDPLAHWLQLDSTYPTPEGRQPYRVRHVPLGGALMFVAGILSGLLGIGSGALKVLAMDHAMRLPFKVSTTTSNFMIGVTAAASAGVYLARGYIDPGLAMPVMLGVLAGSLAGTWALAVAPTHVLRRIFALVIVALGVQIVYKGGALIYKELTGS